MTSSEESSNNIIVEDCCSFVVDTHIQSHHPVTHLQPSSDHSAARNTLQPLQLACNAIIPPAFYPTPDLIYL